MELSKEIVFNLINEIVNDFFDQKGDWAAASGLSSALNKITNEYYASPNNQMQSDADCGANLECHHRGDKNCIFCNEQLRR